MVDTKVMLREPTSTWKRFIRFTKDEDVREFTRDFIQGLIVIIVVEGTLYAMDKLSGKRVKLEEGDYKLEDVE